MAVLATGAGEMAVVGMATVELPAGPRLWTFDDLLELPESDWRFEIIDGGLLMTPGPGIWHEAVSDALRRCLWQALPAGLSVLGPMTVDLEPTYLIPDLVVLPRDVVRRGGTRVAASDALLVVEVVSPGSVSTDRHLKPAKYAEAGIPHFWRVEFEPEPSLTAYALPGSPNRTPGGSADPSGHEATGAADIRPGVDAGYGRSGSRPELGDDRDIRPNADLAGRSADVGDRNAEPDHPDADPAGPGATPGRRADGATGYVEVGSWTAGQTAVIRAPFRVEIVLAELAPDR